MPARENVRNFDLIPAVSGFLLAHHAHHFHHALHIHTARLHHVPAEGHHLCHHLFGILPENLSE